MKRLSVALTGFLALPLLSANGPGSADVIVTVTGVSQPTGIVYLSLCRQAEFMTPNCYRSVGRRITNRATQVMTIRGVEPGTYALLAFHDVNDNRLLDRNGYGAPSEPTGFSGRTTSAGQMPQFARSAFTVNGQRLNLRIGLR